MVEGKRPYDIQNDPKLEEILLKLKRKDKISYDRIIKQMLKIAENPQMGKPLHRPLAGKRRVHVGHFVLMYEINENERKVVFLDFKRHDEAYR